MAEAGRPSLYSQELADRICNDLADGMSLRAVCRQEGMPAIGTVLRWVGEEDKAAFRDQYARARTVLQEHWAEEILEISDDSTRDTIEKTDEDGKVYAEVPNTEWITRSRLRVDSRKWLLSKLAPKKYGEKVTAELTGADGGPVQVADVTDMEIARRVVYLLERGMQAALQAPMKED